jgi:hypothetical protein
MARQLEGSLKPSFPLSLQDLQYYLLSGAGVPEESLPIYEETYRVWKMIWSQTLREVDNVSEIPCDGFTRQTKIGALFYKDRCIAMTTCHEVDFKFSSHRDDSLLAAWDEEAFRLLTKDGTKVSICSYLSVHPDFRGEVAPGIVLKHLATYLIVKVFLNSDCDVMTGTMRVSRGTDKSAYGAGATFLKRSSMHGEEADLVAFYRSHIENSGTRYQHLWAERLWNQKIDLLEKEQRTFRKTG